MKEVVTIDGQTIYDIAAQHYGSADGVGQLIRDNPTLNYYDEIPGGMTILIDESKVIDRKVVEEFAAAGMPPGTRFVNTNNWLLADGHWNNGGVWVNEEYWHNTH